LLTINNGTNASTLVATVTGSAGGQFNGDDISATDNIAKDATTGNFSLNSTGTILTIVNAGLTGDCLAVLAAVVALNASGADLTVAGTKTASGLQLSLHNATTGGYLDITTLVDTGQILIYITYLTDA
jgi:hypothetical protein